MNAFSTLLESFGHLPLEQTVLLVALGALGLAGFAIFAVWSIAKERRAHRR
jgi:hypothetical protein